MEHQSAEPNEQAFLVVNVPLNCFNLAANIFYAWCLIFPPSNRPRLKQPLKTLLGLLVCMTCSVWLNFYYYIQIVPSRRAFLVWLKKNIRPVIFIAVFLDGPFFFISSAVTVADIFSTFRYLRGHIRRVAQDGSRFSTPRVQSQMRVTITGVSQGVLYLLYSTFYLFDSFAYNLSSRMALSLWVSFTVTSVYISGTTVNLGIGQTTFRKRAAEVWKALKALCCVGVVTNDVKMHTR
ncbi:uncharacterized protein LOC143330810 [Chaetodon auriga]|uniref:uncharacterized protein LOC143330810 n=1 Tax=Chaetodon auriga TaxID=39042 RepID=UPI004032B8CC